jgi:molybdopterin synthase sulfur carrier subunit
MSPARTDVLRAIWVAKWTSKQHTPSSRVATDAARKETKESAMAIHVKIPTPLRKFTAGQASVAVEGATVGEALKALDTAHSGLWDKVIDARGKVRRFINVYAGDEDIRFLDGLETAVADGAELSIIPAIAGGC